MKPIEPIEGLKDHSRLWVVVYSGPQKKVLGELIGTLTHEKAEKMQKVIEDEFERVEGDWK